jgi:hypothetical protein
MSERPENEGETTPEAPLDTPPEALPEALAPLVASMRADVLGPAAVADVALRVEQAIRALPPHAAPAPQGAALTGAKSAWLATLAVTGGAALLVAALRGLAPGDAPTPTNPAAPAATTHDETPRATPSAPTAATPAEVPNPVAPNPVAPNAEAPPPPAAANDDTPSNAYAAPREMSDAVTHPAGRARPHAHTLDPSADADAEHVLLVEARRTLPGDPARALALADQHAARFAAGMLAPEREMIAVDALEALGRREVAARRAATLVARWPGSSYARRVRARGLVP